MAIFSIFQILSIAVFCIYLTGLVNNVFSERENACDMTYMYEYPQFVRVKVEENPAYPQYALYAYSEGRFTERARSMRFDGIPVLFLPGNSGSHKQVRSLASVALRKSLSSRKHSFHFDYFTVDFNEEKSGLFGGVLERQMHFSVLCLETILNLYSIEGNFKHHKPTSVIVIGHSMGGIVGKGLSSLPRSQGLVRLLITLATPQQPVISADAFTEDFYRLVGNTWAGDDRRQFLPLLVSVGGGPRDLLVPPALTASPHAAINVQTTAIPGVWLSTDHLCIVWCRQLVLVLTRLLSASVDPITRQLSAERTHLAALSRHHLLVGHSLNHSHHAFQAEFIADSNWHEDSRRTYSFKHEHGVTKTWYYMVRLSELPGHEQVTFIMTGGEDRDWVFGCQAKYVHAQHRVCLSGRHLSQRSVWAPSTNGRRREATLNLRALHASYPHWTHVLVRVSPGTSLVAVQVDVHSPAARTLTAVLPAWGSPISMGLEIPAHVVRLRVLLPGMRLHSAHILSVVTGAHCHASARLHVPWASYQDFSQVFSDTRTNPMRIRLFTADPQNDRNTSESAHLDFLLDAECAYTLSISWSASDSMGQLWRHYATSLPAYLVAVVLLVLRAAMADLESRGRCQSLHASLCGPHLKPYYLIMSARLGLAAIAAAPVLREASAELRLGASAAPPFLLLPLLLHCVALGTAHVLAAVLWALLLCSGRVVHAVVPRLAGLAGLRRGWDWASVALRGAPGAAAVLLTATATASCGAAALIAGSVLYFTLLTKMYEDYLENFVYKTISKVAKKFVKPRKKDDIVSEKESNRKVCDIQKDEVDESQVQLVETVCKVSISSETIDKVIKKEPLKERTMDIGDSTDKSIKITEKPDKSSSAKDSINEEMVLIGDEDESVPSSLHFHMAMFLVWILTMLLYVPTLLTWAHDFKYSKRLERDPSYLPALVLCASAAFLWQARVPRPYVKYYGVMDKVLYGAAVTAIMAGPLAVYRLPYILVACFCLVTIHQAIAPGVPPLPKPLNPPTPNVDIDKVKLMQEKLDTE